MTQILMFASCHSIRVRNMMCSFNTHLTESSHLQLCALFFDEGKGANSVGRWNSLELSVAGWEAVGLHLVLSSYQPWLQRTPEAAHPKLGVRESARESVSQMQWKQISWGQNNGFARSVKHSGLRGS